MSSLVGKIVGKPYTILIEGAVRLNTTAPIDAFVTGNHAIHTGATGLLTIIQYVVVRSTAASGITVPLLAGVGVSGTEIYPDQQLLGLTQAGKHWIFPSGVGSAPAVLGGQVLNLVISAAPIGTSQTVVVDVFGHEL